MHEIDGIIQPDSAGSEGLASAAEPLNVHVRDMKRLAGERVAMVEGARQGIHRHVTEHAALPEVEERKLIAFASG